jgi:hypothetical protein
MRRAACRSMRYVGGAYRPACPAGADDEHHQRRRACGQPDRLPGIHDHAGGRAVASPKRCAWGAEVFHTLKKGAFGRRGWRQYQRGRRGRLCAPILPSAAPALDFVMKPRSSRPASRRASDIWPWRSIAPSTEFFKGGKYVYDQRRRRHSRSPVKEHGGLPRQAVPSRLSDHLDRGWPVRG